MLARRKELEPLPSRGIVAGAPVPDQHVLVEPKPRALQRAIDEEVVIAGAAVVAFILIPRIVVLWCCV